MTDQRDFSSRAPWSATPNRLSEAVLARRIAGKTILDLTVSNPTRAGFQYPRAELCDALREASTHPYDPTPLGLDATRQAVATFLSTDEDVVDAEDIVITASTSEGYGFLFKLLCEPGDAVLTHAPEYPLLDHLAGLEGVRLRRFPLEYLAGSRRPWRVDPDEIRRHMSDDLGAIVMIHPNNPTGSYLQKEEMEAVCEIAAGGIALISDEVFADYALGDDGRAGSAAAETLGLAFSLGGLSKSAGLPHWKIGWIRIGGDPLLRVRARSALEVIGDSYLSVSTPTQVAAITALKHAPGIRGQITSRLLSNLTAIRAIADATPPIECLPVGGGWSVVLRVPAIATDEELALELLESAGILVHPGYLFEFDREGFLVLSLLTPPEIFREGASRLAEHVAARIR